MNIADLLNNVVNQFIVTPSGDPGYIGSKGFVFDILGDEEAMFDSDITDHYVEENFSIQDHIALRPPEFMLTGFVGEITDIFQNAFLNILTTVQSMSAVSDYTLQFGAQATQVYNQIAAVASQVGVVLNQAQNVYNTISGPSTTEGKQQSAYNKFVDLYMNRTLCTVETPWAVWKNMGIKSIRILQRDKDKFVSEFSVTFKQIRKVSAAQVFESVYQGGRVSDYNALPAIVAGSVSGQTVLADGTIVSTDLLSKGFNLPVWAQ
jgi:hypothetical protein